MRPGKTYHCKTCYDSGYVRSTSGPLEPCPHCRRGAAAALIRSQSRNDPAQVGRTLKIILYSGVAAAAWAIYRWSGDGTRAEDRDEVNATNTSGPGAANDFSPWEPEP